MRNRSLSDSAEATQEFGRRLGQQLGSNSIVAFFGDLGAGKTTCIKGLVAEAAGIDPKEVNSPTFTYLNIYTGRMTVYHFDLYRLRRSEEFFAMGFEEYFQAGGICCIEWAERIDSLLPEEAIQVTLKAGEQNQREIWIDGEKNLIR